MRELVCRGKAGIELRVFRDPSDKDSSGKQVTMQLTYTPAASKPGTDFGGLQAGECSWNPLGLAEVPKTLSTAKTSAVTLTGGTLRYRTSRPERGSLSF